MKIRELCYQFDKSLSGTWTYSQRRLRPLSTRGAVEEEESTRGAVDEEEEEEEEEEEDEEEGDTRAMENSNLERKAIQ